MAHLSQEEQLKLIADLEIEMMADMYNRYHGMTVSVDACVGLNWLLVSFFITR